MSTGEETHTATLTDFAPDTTEDTQSTEAADWEPDDPRQCRNCGSKVSDQYRRCLGDNQDIVHECPRCPSEDTGHARRRNGAAAGLDVQDRKLTTQVSYQ
jgi:hypothetical protein